MKKNGYRGIYRGFYLFRCLDPFDPCQEVFYAFNNAHRVPLARHKLSSCKNRVHLPP